MTGKDGTRDERLKAALRENLKRRKAQARARRDERPPADDAMCRGTQRDTSK